jgi:type IV fimbrial biogenesis protein FimT
MRGMTYGRRAAGFTMTELIVTMSIVAILLAIGIPSFRYVTVSNRISSEVNGLLGDMQYARSIAVKEGLYVTVCVSDNQIQCSNKSSWQDGWIVFLDSDGDQVRQGHEAIVRVQNRFSSSDKFQPEAGSFSAITFNREGYATTGNAGTVTLALHDFTGNLPLTRCLAVTPVGMLTTQKYQQGVPQCL